MERGEFGEAAVPSHAYYGVRTKLAMERFRDAGRDYKHDLLIALASLKRCAARAEADAGRLEQRLASQLERSAQEIAEGRWHDQFVFEPNRCGFGALLSLNMNEVLVNRTMELLGEDKGSYHLLSPDWHAESTLHPNRFFTAAFQLASVRYVADMLRCANTLPAHLSKALVPVLRPLYERLCRIDPDHFDAAFVAKLARATNLPLRPERTSVPYAESVYDLTASSMKASIAAIEPAIHQIDSVELKAGIIQISAFRDMISYIAKSGFSAQGMEEVAAYYAWQCLDSFYRALIKINQIYH